MAIELDYSSLLRPGIPAPAKRWGGFPPFNFVGGNNDAPSVPVEDMIEATAAVLRREGATLSTYGMQSGPQGYTPLRQFVADKLGKRSGMTVSADDVLITSGSNHGLELVNSILCAPGDVVLVEQFSYGSALGRLRKFGATPVGIPLDDDGMRMDLLAAKLAELKAEGVTPKYIYIIPTIQNPGGSILPEDRRRELLRLSEEYGVPILEDECYADLLWDGKRPPAIAAMDEGGNRVIHVGSFSKTIAPALRVGYIAVDWGVLSRMVAIKNDGGTGALEQMMLAEYCATKFDNHIDTLCVTLKGKLDVMIEALEENFGTTAEFVPTKGGIFQWITLPDHVDTMKLAQAAAAEGIAINPGPEWASDAEPARNKFRLCFGSPSLDEIRQGLKKLADICHEEFGVPVRGANVERS
ncbi:MAG: PLP-dependent aminotransferase family protein [Alphaproteobacteria bacterium]|nr:PLP-dependent aminotransferase family protein [Alphaproteobacteria bacterium]